MGFDFEVLVCKPPFLVNSYFFFEREAKKFMLLDPGDGAADKTREYLDQGYKLDKILITHVHADHTWDLLKLTQLASDAEIVLHRDEQYLIDNYVELTRMFGLMQFDPLPDLSSAHFVEQGDVLEFADKKFTVLHVPGHTRGHIAFYTGDADIAFKGDALEASPADASGYCFVGDVIFQGGVGRTDLPGGNEQTLAESIKNKIYKLPDKTILYNGHGNETTVAIEKENNFFVGKQGFYSI